MRTFAIATFTAALLASATAAVAAPVYECTDARGQRSYSQTPAKNCRAASLGQVSSYSPASPAPSAPPIAPTDTTVTPTPNQYASGSPSSTQIQAAQQQVNQARRALEEGKQVRYGNERNYAKYLERIAGLEAAVQQSEQALQQLQAGGEAAPR